MALGKLPKLVGEILTCAGPRRTDILIETILSSDRFVTLSTFTTIHGIGPHTARKLYSLGLRTVEELERYYEVIPGIAAEDTWSHFEAGTTRSEEATEEITIKVALALRQDLTQT